MIAIITSKNQDMILESGSKAEAGGDFVINYSGRVWGYSPKLLLLHFNSGINIGSTLILVSFK